MGYPDRVTVCVSSQSGCAMGCTFCATGQMGPQNNLAAGEIAAQAVWARREAARLPETTPQRLTNVGVHGDGRGDEWVFTSCKKDLPDGQAPSSFVRGISSSSALLRRSSVTDPKATHLG